MKEKLFLFGMLLILLAQTGNGQELTTNDYLKAWDNMTKMVMETAKSVPSDAYNYKPNEEVRSFAEQMNHFSRSNIGLGSMVFGAMPTFQFDKNNPPSDKEGIIELLEKSCSYFKENLKKLDAEKLNGKVSWGRPGSGLEVTRHQGLLMIYSHFQLEYGKTIIYARANNVTPSPSAGWNFFN